MKRDELPAIRRLTQKTFFIFRWDFESLLTLSYLGESTSQLFNANELRIVGDLFLNFFACHSLAMGKEGQIAKVSGSVVGTQFQEAPELTKYFPIGDCVRVLAFKVEPIVQRKRSPQMARLGYAVTKSHLEGMKMKCCSLLLAILLLVCSISSLQADVWDNTFRMQMTNSNGSGFENPLVRVGFNPQPEPPAYDPELNLNDPMVVKLLVDDISVSDGNMRVLFGIAAPFRITAEGEQDDGEYQFRIDGEEPRDSFSVVLEMLTKDGGFPVPGSWQAFNPQPEPPALGIGATGIGFDFAFDSQVTSATLELQILHTSSGTPQSFTLAAVPEPGSLALLGLVSTFGLLQRRRSIFHPSSSK